MGVVVPLNCIDPGLHVVQACPLTGGFSALAWIGPNAQITDFTSAIEWQLDIDADRIMIVKSINGIIPAPSAIEVNTELACGAKTQIINYDRNFTWFDRSRSNDNSEMYSRMMLSTGRIGMYNCNTAGSPLLYLSRNFATFGIGDPAGNQDTTQMYEGEAKWNHLALNEIISGIPVEIFQDVLP